MELAIHLLNIFLAHLALCAVLIGAGIKYIERKEGKRT